MAVQVRRVLVCVQFNQSQETTVRYACLLAERFNAELHVLHVLEETPEPDVATLPPDEAICATEGEETILAGVVPTEFEEKLIVRRAVVFGVPWVAIVRYSWEHEIDVIVLGPSHRSRLGRWVWGSLTDEVVHHAPCPVMVAAASERRFPLA
jgi:nucleotide-binding universal stress UspA family protein